MSEQDKLQEQMAKIGDRYLGRTLSELDQLHELAALALSGSPGQARELEQMAHKIHGSGAMFGFDLLSEHAGEIERIAAALGRRPAPAHLLAMPEQDLRVRLQDFVQKLTEVTRAAALARGVS